MKTEDCTFDRIVYMEQHDHFFRGKIISPVLSSPSTERRFKGNLYPTVVIEWVEEGGDSVSKFPINLLLSEEEGLAGIKRQEDAEALLEKEFEEVRGPIAYKLAEATKALNEANEMAAASKHNLQDFYDAVRPLMNAIRAAGWRASQFSC